MMKADEATESSKGIVLDLILPVCSAHRSLHYWYGLHRWIF